jgi:hypothetical protein
MEEDLVFLYVPDTVVYYKIASVLGVPKDLLGYGRK